MRTFIAIALPEGIRNFLTDIQARLKTSRGDVKWTAAENIHLTLKFLGEIDEKKLNEVSAVLQETLQDKKTFAIKLSALGAFPKTAFPKVIWAGISQGNDEVCGIARDLEEKLAQIGFLPESREFSSHITLGRVRSSQGLVDLAKHLTQLAAGRFPEGMEFTVSRITLFQSRLTPKGPLYAPLNEFNLKTA